MQKIEEQAIRAKDQSQNLTNQNVNSPQHVGFLSKMRVETTQKNTNL